MDTKQITNADVEWTDRGDYLSIGTVSWQDGADMVVTVMESSYLRAGTPNAKEEFYFSPVVGGLFLMSDENDIELGLVTDIRKAAMDEWESREEARAEASC